MEQHAANNGRTAYLVVQRLLARFAQPLLPSTQAAEILRCLGRLHSAVLAIGMRSIKHSSHLLSAAGYGGTCKICCAGMTSAYLLCEKLYYQPPCSDIWGIWCECSLHTSKFFCCLECDKVWHEARIIHLMSGQEDHSHALAGCEGALPSKPKQGRQYKLHAECPFLLRQGLLESL